MLSPLVEEMLKDVEAGSIDAACALADCLMDDGHPDADQIGQLAVQAKTTESFFDAMMALSQIPAIIHKAESSNG